MTRTSRAFVRDAAVSGCAGWDQFVEQKAEFWFSLYAAWIRQCPPEQLLVVQYERLKSQLTTELERVLRFLGVTPDPLRMNCIER